MNPDKLLKITEVAQIYNASIPTVWRRINDGTLPPPIKFGRLSRWPESEVIAAINAAKAKRGEAA